MRSEALSKGQRRDTRRSGARLATGPAGQHVWSGNGLGLFLKDSVLAPIVPKQLQANKKILPLCSSPLESQSLSAGTQWLIV